MIFVVDFPNLISKVILIGFWGTFLFVLAYTIAFHFRAYKLKLIFKGLNQPIKYSTSYFSIGAAFGINDLTPGKVGDLAKIFIIKDQEDIKLSESVAGIAIERVLDLILLFIISCLALVYLYFGNINGTGNIIILGQSIQFYLIIGAFLILAVLIFFILLIYKTKFVLKIINKISKKLGYYLERFLFNFKLGIKKFKDHKRQLVYIIMLGFPSWFFDASIIIIFFYFLGYNLNILVLILASILLFFSKTFPITPGGWGISENIGALFIFIFYPGIPYIEILSILVIEHLFRTAYLFFYGGYSIFHYNFKLKEARELVD
jgi:uncharacterized protein (TIRG00374 family)